MTKQEFAERLKAFCIENGFEIAGTDEAEGIYGEITIRAIGESETWLRWEENKFNFIFN